MTQYLVEWANGSFQVMTGEELAKEVEEWVIGWENNPRPVYRLIPGKEPKRYHVVFDKNWKYWFLKDDHGFPMMIL